MPKKLQPDATCAKTYKAAYAKRLIEPLLFLVEALCVQLSSGGHGQVQEAGLLSKGSWEGMVLHII